MGRWLIWPLVMVTALLLSACSEPVRSPVDEALCDSPAPEQAILRDRLGGQLIHRGMNVSGSAKWSGTLFPAIPPGDLELLSSAGFTSIRLLIFWQGIEPEPGTYDNDYLADIAAWVDHAHEHGLSVLLDLHQDLYGEGFNSTGFPAWTCDEALYNAYEPTEQWFLNYLSHEVTTCFDQFWQSEALQDAYGKAVRQLVHALRQKPNILGIDVMNEPYWGSAELNTFEPRWLQPFYERVYAIAFDDDLDWRFYAGPSVAQNMGFGTYLAPPLGCPPSPWIYAPHYYPLFAEVGQPYDGNIARIDEQIAAMLEDGQTLMAPMAITELGIRNSGTGAAQYLDDVLTVADSYGVSVWLWDFDRGGNGGFALLTADGVPREVFNVLPRPFAHRVPGTLVSQNYNQETRVYELVWEANSVASAEPLVVKLPAEIYPDGFLLGGAYSEGGYDALTATLTIPVSVGDSSVQSITIEPQP